MLWYYTIVGVCLPIFVVIFFLKECILVTYLFHENFTLCSHILLSFHLRIFPGKAVRAFMEERTCECF